jgi:hypothetical protein
MELEVNEQAEVERFERSPDRAAYRNGYRERDLDTRLGTTPPSHPTISQRNALSKPDGVATGEPGTAMLQ